MHYHQKGRRLLCSDLLSLNYSESSRSDSRHAPIAYKTYFQDLYLRAVLCLLDCSSLVIRVPAEAANAAASRQHHAADAYQSCRIHFISISRAPPLVSLSPSSVPGACERVCNRSPGRWLYPEGPSSLASINSARYSAQTLTTGITEACLPISRSRQASRFANLLHDDVESRLKVEVRDTSLVA
jgi:hypothetical protein